MTEFGERSHRGTTADSTDGVSSSFGALGVTTSPHPPGTVVLHVHGQVDSATAPFLTEQVTTALRTATGLMLDLEAVNFLSSAGLAALMSGRDAAAAAGVGFQLACGDSRPARRGLQVTGTWGLFDIVDPTPTAPDALSAPIFPVPDLDT